MTRGKLVVAVTLHYHYGINIISPSMDNARVQKEVIQLWNKIVKLINDHHHLVAQSSQTENFENANTHV